MINDEERVMLHAAALRQLRPTEWESFVRSLEAVSKAETDKLVNAAPVSLPLAQGRAQMSVALLKMLRVDDTAAALIREKAKQ
jgi:hypothetical protein